MDVLDSRSLPSSSLSNVDVPERIDHWYQSPNFCDVKLKPASRGLVLKVIIQGCSTMTAVRVCMQSMETAFSRQILQKESAQKDGGILSIKGSAINCLWK